MKLYTKDIAKMIDISCVRSYMNWADIRQMAEAALAYKFICAHVLPANVPFAKSLLQSDPEVMVGCPVGFPGGGVTTATKVFEMRQCIEMGADEIDAVMNIGWIRSGRYQEAEDDIRQVIDAAGGRPIKTIIEVMTLSDEEIVAVCKIAEQAGAAYIKTGTGWITGKPTTMHHIEVIRKQIGDRLKIKASGGIRGLDTLLDMYKMGVSRFGVGFLDAMNIIEECEKHPEGIEV
jgi:deoxyribose-phosphate aldolase